MLHERGALVAPAIPATLAGKCEATKTPRNRKGCAQHARGGRTRFLWLGMRQSSFTVIPYLRKPNKTQKANKTSTRCSKHAYLPPPPMPSAMTSSACSPSCFCPCGSFSSLFLTPVPSSRPQLSFPCPSWC